MASKIRAWLQYIFILSLTGALLWIAVRRMISGEEHPDILGLLKNTWVESDKFYMMLMAVVALLSHAIRAERWKMLLNASAQNTTFWKAFQSLMIGYLVNLAIPRGGELSRCYNLYKLDKIPVETSLGSVVTERVIDLLCLLSVFFIAMLLEFQSVYTLYKNLFDKIPLDNSSGIKYFVILVLIASVTAIAAFFILKGAKFKSRVTQLWLGFKSGLFSVFNIRNKTLFSIHTVSIWILYLLMTKLVLMAFPETSMLNTGAVLVVFTLGLIAMAIPLPGGAGSYHVLIPLALVGLYSIPESRAIAFTFIFHAWQSVILILAGAVSLVSSFIIIRWQAQIKS